MQSNFCTVISFIHPISISMPGNGEDYHGVDGDNIPIFYIDIFFIGTPLNLLLFILFFLISRRYLHQYRWNDPQFLLACKPPPQVDTGINLPGILRCHSPEGKFHYAGGVMFIAHHIFIQSVLQAADRNYIYSILPFVRVVSNPN